MPHCAMYGMSLERAGQKWRSQAQAGARKLALLYRQPPSMRSGIRRLKEWDCCMKEEEGTTSAAAGCAAKTMKVNGREMYMDGNGGPEEHNAAWRSDVAESWLEVTMRAVAGPETACDTRGGA
jgi:hypothetical protein